MASFTSNARGGDLARRGLDRAIPRQTRLASANVACHLSAAVMLLHNDDDDVFVTPTPILPFSELEEHLAIVAVLSAQLERGSFAAAWLGLREVQCRRALAACRTMDFSGKMRRALSAKVLHLENEARGAVRRARRARRASEAPPA